MDRSTTPTTGSSTTADERIRTTASCPCAPATTITRTRLGATWPSPWNTSASKQALPESSEESRRTSTARSRGWPNTTAPLARPRDRAELPNAATKRVEPRRVLRSFTAIFYVWGYSDTPYHWISACDQLNSGNYRANCWDCGHEDTGSKQVWMSLARHPGDILCVFLRRRHVLSITMSS